MYDLQFIFEFKNKFKYKISISIIMSIYKIWYSDFVKADKQNIGKRVKVFKGRKYPIGNEYTIKYFTAWRDVFGNIRTEYAVMETGEKINIDNLKLVNPNVKKEKIEKMMSVSHEHFFSLLLEQERPPPSVCYSSRLRRRFFLLLRRG